MCTINFKVGTKIMQCLKEDFAKVLIRSQWPWKRVLRTFVYHNPCAIFSQWNDNAAIFFF